jgi:hypothetical protein
MNDSLTLTNAAALLLAAIAVDPSAAGMIGLLLLGAALSELQQRD